MKSAKKEKDMADAQEPVTTDVQAPVETPADTPETQAPVEPVETEVEKVVDDIKKVCWNCKEKLVKGVCKKCGFDLSLVNNSQLN